MKKIQVKDIPTKEVLEYQLKWSQNNSMMWSTEHSQMVQNMPFCYEALPYPPKVIYRKMEKLVDEGYLEYGVSLRTAWLTDKGMEYLRG